MYIEHFFFFIAIFRSYIVTCESYHCVPSMRLTKMLAWSFVEIRNALPGGYTLFRRILFIKTLAEVFSKRESKVTLNECV